MTLYVDNAAWPGTIGPFTTTWYNLVAGPYDDETQLRDVAARLGLQQRWYQDAKGWPYGRYRITAAKRQEAIDVHGVTAVTWQQLARMTLFAARTGPLPRGRLPVITARQPLAAAITSLGKDVINRPARIAPGYFWLHAGSRGWWDTAAAADAQIAAAWEKANPGARLNRDTTLMPFGAVVALARITGAHHSVSCVPWCSPWAVTGRVHNQVEITSVLRDPVPAHGKKDAWHLDDDDEQACLDSVLAAVMGLPRDSDGAARPLEAAQPDA